MDLLSGFDKNDFLLSTSVGVIVVRGTIVYLSLIALLRFVLKREAGSLGIADLLVVVLLGDAAQNAMAGECKSVADGLVLIGTIILWAYTLDWLSYRFPSWERILSPPALVLVKDGKMLRRNMRREFVSEDELMSQIRQQGLEDLTEVRKAYIEGDGRISVIKRNGESHPAPKREAS